MLPLRERTEVVLTGRAMASPWTIRMTIDDDAAERQRALDAMRSAAAVLAEVDRTCTRFDPASDLMRANAAPQEWHRVATPCFDGLVAAYSAYRRTNGRFDPRVHDDLVRLGYERSRTVTEPGGSDPLALERRQPLETWDPSFDRANQRVRLGAHRVDLGGIGKGLAVRWASARLSSVGRGHLVNAGGDCHCVGRAPSGEPWRVGVEGIGTTDPVAVLEVSDAAVATSSTRLLHWSVAGRDVHHLIDPTTGLPGGAGLTSVTVVDADPADAEVWSKVLFLTGAGGVATSAELFGIAALWVDEAGTVRWSTPMAPHVCWSRP